MQNLCLHFKFLSSPCEPFRMIHSAVIQATFIINIAYVCSFVRPFLSSTSASPKRKLSLLLFYTLKLYETSLVNFLALPAATVAVSCVYLHFTSLKGATSRRSESKFMYSMDAMLSSCFFLQRARAEKSDASARMFFPSLQLR